MHPDLKMAADGDSVAIAVTRAHTAQIAWRATEMKKRVEHLDGLAGELLRARDRVVDVVDHEAGKQPFETLTTDVLPTLEMLRWLVRRGPQALRPRSLPTPLILKPGRSRVEYRPRGVVLVIAPWNNPLQLALVPAATALAAGNAVILKPSERTPLTGRLIAELSERAGLPAGVMQVVNGGPEIAQALIDAQPDMIFFTGGTANGRAVLQAAARNLTPVVLELGGKDAAIVFADADLERAARAITYGAFSHAGQHCVSLKRLYVEAPRYREFMERLAEETRTLAMTGDWGRVAGERAGNVACEQLREALSAGARMLCPSAPDRAGHEPTLVADATHAMRLMREETFAPVLAAMPFADEENAVALANDSPYGLNASLWSGDMQRGARVAARLECGNVYINGALINIGNPHLPFGGVKWSGMGRYHGAEGLRAFCVETAIMASRSPHRSEPMWFPHDESKRRVVEELLELRYGKAGAWRRTVGWLRLIGRI